MIYKGKTKAYTIIEMVIVGLLIFGMAGSGFYFFNKERMGARNAKRMNDMKILVNTINTSIAKDYIFQEGENKEIKTNIGTIKPYRGSKLELVDKDSFNQNILPEAPQDPYGNPYVIAYLEDPRVFQIISTGEDELTKEKNSIVSGTFRNGSEVDVVASRTRASDDTILIYHPEYFMVGDILQIKKEELEVLDIDADKNILRVKRGSGADYIYEGTPIAIKKMEHQSLVEFIGNDENYKSGLVENKGEVFIYDDTR